MSAPNPDSPAGMVAPQASPAPDRAGGTVDPQVSPGGGGAGELVDRRVVPAPDPAGGTVDSGTLLGPDGAGGIVDPRVLAGPEGTAGMVDGGVLSSPDRAAGMVDGPVLPGPDRAAGIVDRLSVIPPAARRLQGQRAGLITRLLANTVDFGVAAAIVAGGYLGIAALLFLWNSRSFTFPAPGFGVLVIAGGVVMTLYLTACWIASGRTYGDHLLGLRVLGLRGRPPRPVSALLRAVLCVVFPIGLFWIVVSRDNRSVQDVLLRSSVVYDWSRTPLSGSRSTTGRGAGGAGDML